MYCPYKPTSQLFHVPVTLKRSVLGVSPPPVIPLFSTLYPFHIDPLAGPTAICSAAERKPAFCRLQFSFKPDN